MVGWQRKMDMGKLSVIDYVHIGLDECLPGVPLARVLGFALVPRRCSMHDMLPPCMRRSFLQSGKRILYQSRL